jgi:predicted RNA binding protein YcfA (HicA-like mRNA interferase family)
MPRVLKVREFTRRMKQLGIHIKRGKGSERKLSRTGYHLYTIKAHGDGQDVYPHVVNSACDRLGIDREEFWKGI